MSMKNIIIGLIMISTSVMGDTFGYVNMESVFTSAKMVKDFQENMKQKQEEYEKFLTKQQKKITKARESEKTDEEIQEIITGIEEAVLPKRQEMAQLEAGFQQNLLTSIKRISKDVAKELGVDVVVDNRVVFYGGIDMTDLVLDKLNQ